MSRKPLTPEQREAKRLRDRKYRAAKKAAKMMAQGKKPEKKPVVKNTPKTPAKAVQKKPVSSVKKSAAKPQKPSKPCSCACKKHKKDGVAISGVISIELSGPGVDLITEKMRKQFDLLLEANKIMIHDILSCK